jgi:hypothetical protein
MLLLLTRRATYNRCCYAKQNPTSKKRPGFLLPLLKNHKTIIPLSELLWLQTPGIALYIIIKSAVAFFSPDDVTVF